MGEGSHFWRGLYPRVRSSIVRKAHLMTNDKLLKVSLMCAERTQLINDAEGK